MTEKSTLKRFVLEYEQFFNGTVDMTPITEFLDIAPIKDAPESRINEGTLDWRSCEIDFIRALALYFQTRRF